MDAMGNGMSGGTQLFRDDFINHEIRIPIEQPYNPIDFIECFFVFFVAHVDDISGPRSTLDETLSSSQHAGTLWVWNPGR